jgi:hypothetical protein
MPRQGPAGPGKKLTSIVMLMLAVGIFVAGCGPQTPDAAVRSFYSSIQKHDWNAYLSAVLPENVRRMTEADSKAQKKDFLSSDFLYKDLKLKPVYSNKDKNKADVQLEAGTIVGKDPTTGKTQQTTIAEIKKTYGVTPAIATQKYKGRWYVDVPLSAVDKAKAQSQSQGQ